MLLRESLADRLHLLWPRRIHQELLLDLGERKGWGKPEYFGAAEAAAAHLSEQLLLPTTLAMSPGESSSDPLAALRLLGENLAKPTSPPGVARWISGLASAVGAAPKTLANSLSQGISAERREHRWLRLIDRLLRGGMALDAWLYHRRSPSCVAAELARGGASPVLDAGDAVLLFSLIALWQRRRPTSEARANRGHSLTRRQTPKPIANLQGNLLVPRQLQHLARVAERLPGPAGQALGLLATEAALTEAHLAPHAARKSRTNMAESGEDWLCAVEGLLVNGQKGLFSPADDAMIRFRVDRMRAWRDGTPQRQPSLLIANEPYVRAALALERRHSAPSMERFSPHSPGLLMFLPQLRRLGWLEEP